MLNTQFALVLDKKINEKMYFENRKNCIFYGINDSNQGIFYNVKNNTIDFVALAKE